MKGRGEGIWGVVAGEEERILLGRLESQAVLALRVIIVNMNPDSTGETKIIWSLFDMR